MKKAVSLLLVSIMCFGLVFSLPVSAATPEMPKNLKYSDGYVTWDTVAGAESYVLEIAHFRKGSVVTERVYTTSYRVDIAVEYGFGEYAIKVSAKSAGITGPYAYLKYDCSEYMPEVRIELDGVETGSPLSSVTPILDSYDSKRFSAKVVGGYIGNDMENVANNGISMNKTDILSPGETYVISVLFTPKKDVYFYDSSKTPAKFYVNNLLSVNSTPDADTATVNCVVTLDGQSQQELIQNIEINDITLPALKEIPDLEYSIPENANYIANGSYWVSYSKVIDSRETYNKSTIVTSGEKFKSNIHYAFVAKVKTKNDNYKFRNYTTATVNGIEAITICNSGSEMTVFVELGYLSCTHTGGTASCTERAICENCDEEYGSYKSHKYTKKTITSPYIKSKATFSSNAKFYYRCSACGKKGTKYYSDTTKYRYVKTITLSKTAFTYNGKIQTPTITVKDANGKKLTKNTHYTISYASGRKNVGKYKITIKLRGTYYSGTKYVYYTIKPAPTKVTKLTPAKKSLKVSFTRKTTQTTGYQIAYSTSKTFKSPKYKTVSRYKSSSTTLTGLSAKKTYYVKIRTYKTVGGVKYYSGWSTYKYAKTK